MVDLSICIPTLEERRHILPIILSQIYEQIAKYSHQITVEVLIECDNRSLTLGAKRNIMVERSRGFYIVFLDDDDLISPHFIESYVPMLITKQHDCGALKGAYYQQGKFQKYIEYLMKYNGWKETIHVYQRYIQHLNIMKRSILQKSPWPDVNWGEDGIFCKQLYESRLIRTEFIPEHFNTQPLYHYLDGWKTLRFCYQHKWNPSLQLYEFELNIPAQNFISSSNNNICLLNAEYGNITKEKRNVKDVTDIALKSLHNKQVMTPLININDIFYGSNIDLLPGIAKSLYLTVGHLKNNQLYTYNIELKEVFGLLQYPQAKKYLCIQAIEGNITHHLNALTLGIWLAKKWDRTFQCKPTEHVIQGINLFDLLQPLEQVTTFSTECPFSILEQVICPFIGANSQSYLPCDEEWFLKSQNPDEYKNKDLIVYVTDPGDIATLPRHIRNELLPLHYGIWCVGLNERLTSVLSQYYTNKLFTFSYDTIQKDNDKNDEKKQCIITYPQIQDDLTSKGLVESEIEIVCRSLALLADTFIPAMTMNEFSRSIIFFRQ